MAGGDGAREDHCHCRHVDFLIGSYPRVGKDAIIQRIGELDDNADGILEDQAIFDNTLKSIRSHQEDHEAKLETMLVQQQGMVDKLIKYLKNVEDRMKELRGVQESRHQARSTPRSCPGVFGEKADDVEDSRRRSGAHGGSHGVGAIRSATG